MKIAGLEAGPLLDYWVGKAQGLQVEIVVSRGAGSEMCVIEDGDAFIPRTSWVQAGPLIEREHIDLISDFVRWMARHGKRQDYSRADVSPLVTAMRAYLMWEYGDEVAAGARRRAGSARTRQVSAKPAPRAVRKSAAARTPYCSSMASAWSTAAAKSMFGRPMPALLLVEVCMRTRYRLCSIDW